MVMRVKRDKPSTPSVKQAQSDSWTTTGDHDFSSNNKPNKRAKFMLFAKAGVGKTAFVCRHAPDPIAILDIDGRALPTVEQARRDLGKTIHHVEILLPGEEGDPDETKLFAQSSLNKLFKNLKWAVGQSALGKMSTVYVDGCTEVDLLAKLAWDGCKAQTKEGAFGKDKDFINYQFWRIINIWRRGNAHLVLSSREKEIYKDHEATGDFTFRAAKVIDEAVDFSLQLRERDRMDGKGKKYEIKVIKSGINRSKSGKVYRESEWQEFGPFAHICNDIYSDLYEDGSVTDWI